MKVSIITSCYNRAGTIRCAIESVLAQDYPDIEYIIVDGASTDGSTEIIRQYEGKVARIIPNPIEECMRLLIKVSAQLPGILSV